MSALDPVLGFAGAGMQLVGDLYGAHEAQEIAEDNRTLQRETQARNEALQREFAQHGIRWRVEDAKAAGLHPLFALTGGGAAYSPSSVVGDVPEARYGKAISNMGQNLTRAAMAQETEFQREERSLRLQLLRSQIDETDARTFAIYSEDALGRQGAGQLPAFPDPEYPAATLNPHFDFHRNRVEVKPDSQVSSRLDDRSVRAGVHPGHMRYQVTPWTQLDLPSSDEGLSEAFENMGIFSGTAYMMRNAARMGISTPQLLSRLFREFMNTPMPAARKEFSGAGMPWWWHHDVDGYGRRPARR